MPSPGEDVQAWSVVASDNGTADPLIVWSEGQARASVNNSARGMLAAHAKDRNLKNGSIVTTGSANAQQFLSGLTYTTIPAGMVVKLKIGAGLTNTASVTLNMDGLGDVLVKDDQDNVLLGGELVGDSYTDFLYNGTNWIFLYSRAFFFDLVTGGGGIILGHQTFSTTGTFTYTPTPQTECVIIECIGGGGGGGGVFGAPSQLNTGGGGGSGGYSRSIKMAADLGSSQTVIVAAGGGGGGPGSNGAPGGATSVGALCTANGGLGGGHTQSEVATGAGGAGGAPGTGDIAAAGAPGHEGLFGEVGTQQRAAGTGGSSVFGGGAFGIIAVAGQPGRAYGSGGSGASNWNGGYNFGGIGSSGVVFITEFGGRGAAGRDGPQGPIGPAGPAGAGTGDVLRSGTPVVNQIARWTDTSHITGVDIATLITDTSFTTGDAKITFKTAADTGWVMMNDGTVGSATSGSSTRANADTQALFTLLFNNITDTWAPILTSAGAGTTRVAQTNAATAWAANCRMSLPKQLGRSIASAGIGSGLSSRPLGAILGEENHLLSVAEMPQHDHTGVLYSPNDATANFGPAWGGPGNPLAMGVQPQGGGAVHNVMQPTVFWNVMIKL